MNLTTYERQQEGNPQKVNSYAGLDHEPLLSPDFFASVLVTTDSMRWHMEPNQVAQVE